MRIERILICLAFLGNIGLPFCFSASIELKSGRTVQGEIIENDGQSLKVDFFGVPVRYYNDEIESVDGKPLETVSGAISSANQAKPLSIAAAVSSLGYNLEIAKSLESKLQPLQTTFAIKDAKDISGVYASLKSNLEAVRKFIGLADGATNPDGLMLYGLLAGQDILNDMKLCAPIVTERQNDSINKVFACHLHSVIGLVVLRASGLDVVGVETDDIRLLAKSLLKDAHAKITPELLNSIESLFPDDKHVLTLIRVGHSAILYDPINCSVSEPFDFSMYYQNMGHGYYKLTVEKSDILPASIKILSDADLRGMFYSNFAHTLVEFDRIDEAMSYTNKALDFSSADPILHTFLGELYARKKNYSQARKEYEGALTLFPKDGYSRFRAATYKDLGISYGNQANYPKAIEYFETALNLDPNQRDIYAPLSLMYKDVGNFSAMRETLNRGIAVAKEKNDAAALQDLQNIAKE